MGDRVDMIEKACLEMDKANIKVKRTSSLFETAPMYVLDQDPFMNGVCEVSLSNIDSRDTEDVYQLLGGNNYGTT